MSWWAISDAQNHADVMDDSAMTWRKYGDVSWIRIGRRHPLNAGCRGVTTGSPWQIGHGQMEYGLGGLFRSFARAVAPMVKSGAKSIGKNSLKHRS